MTVDMIGGKWKVLILWHLFQGSKRYGELRRLLPKVTQKVLTQQLRELEADKLIERKVYTQVPPKVEYSASHFGKKLEPILDEICRWGEEYAAAFPVGDDKPSSCLAARKSVPSP